MKTLIIIPAYNEAKSIENTIRKIESEENFDYIIINDGSTDDTLKICYENGFNVIDLPINLGIGGAVQTGYKYALQNDYDIAIQMDADGQHDPKYIPALVDKINEWYDSVIGSRFIEKKGFQSTFVRRLGIKLYSRIIKILTKCEIKDTTSGYRAANKKIIKLFALDYPVDYPEPETNALIAKRKYKITEIPMQMIERKEGKSSITPFKSVYYALKVGMAIIISCVFEKGEE